MLKITIIAVGRLKDEFFTKASKEYLKRLRAFCDMDVIELKNSRDPKTETVQETERILKKEELCIKPLISADSFVIALSPEGKKTDSVGFSKILKSRGHSSLTFIIGGSYGLSDNIKREADMVLSFSDMTFPHRLFRIMLLEQIYRGFMIEEGRKYHK